MLRSTDSLKFRQLEIDGANGEKYGDKINLVLTDIEMPNLDGLGLTERIRHNPRFASLPVLAVTSVCGKRLKNAV